MSTDLKIAAKNSIVYSLGNVATKLVGVILLPIYTNPIYFTEADFGILTDVEIITQLLIAILGISLYQSLIRWYWDKDYINKQKRIVFTISVSILAFSILCYVPYSVFTNSISSFLLHSENHDYLLKLVYLSAFLQTIIIIPFTLFKLQSKAIAYSVFNIIKLMVVLLLTIYFVVFQKRNVEGIFEAQCIGNLILLIILLPYYIKNIKLNFEFNELKSLLKYSYPLILASISGVLLSIFDRIGLTKMKGLEETAIYGFGFKLANTIKLVVISSIQMAITPMLFKKMNDNDAKDFYKNTFFIVSATVIFVILGLSVFSKEIIKIFATNDSFFIKSIFIIPVISFSFLFGAMKDVVIIGLHIKKKTRIIGTILVLVATLNFILNYLLIPIWGIYGASISTLFAQVIFFIIIYHYAQKSYKVPYSFLRLSLISLFAIIIIAFSFALNEFSLIITISAKVILMIIYFYLIYSLILKKEERSFLINMIRNKS